MMSLFGIAMLSITSFVLASEANGEQLPSGECVCTMEYVPVCGVDGETYGNDCSRKCRGVEKAYDGECGVIDNEIDAEKKGVTISVPPHCVGWFDGCNTCTAKDGTIGACTEMACVRMLRPKCLKYDFQYLNDDHVNMIQEKVESYLAGLQGTPEEQGLKLNALLNTVLKKRVELTKKLSVSRFESGSPELLKILITLEVLDAIDSEL